MSDKKELIIEQTREKLFAKMSAAKKSFESAKEEYVAFNKKNLLTVKQNPTVHELQKMQKKLGNKPVLEHELANKAAANKVAMSKFVQKGE